MIELAGVVVAGRTRPILDGLSLSVGPGEIHAIIGAPGAGKTTAIRVLMGRRRPVRGIAQVMGFDCSFQSVDVQGSATFVPEAGQIDPRMTPRQHVQWMLELAGGRPDPVRVRRAMREAEIADRHFDVAMRAVPAECHVLVWLALAELRCHRVIVLDDPTRRLSFAEAARVSRVLVERSSRGDSILFATRDSRFGADTAGSATLLEPSRTRPSFGRLAAGRVGG